MKQSYHGLVPKRTEMVILLQSKSTELYRNVPSSLHRYMANVPNRVPKCTETYRNVPNDPTSGVPKRTERVYNPFGFGT
ncbi:MAG: hypothetical protein JW384_00250 [Nitrosomonadaceae bacterium]|nr:hypothetical protein [Nitrosomonadaceae bacterium]